MIDIEIMNAKPIDIDIEQKSATDIERTAGGSPDVTTWQGILGRPFTYLSGYFYVENGKLYILTAEEVEEGNNMPASSNAVYEAIRPLAERVATVKDGKDGADGKDGIDGRDGYTPVKGIDYFDGNDGADGRDGYTPRKGIDYVDGKDGKDGQNGKDFKYEDFTPAQLEALKGAKGDAGYTPVKGTDYYTPTEKAELIREISSAVGGLEYVFLNSSQVDAHGKPNFVGASNKFYFVPDPSGESPNLFTEWLYTERGWEIVGASKINLDGYATETWVQNQGYITGYTESDPTVPAWAKESKKPTYTASEVGALPDTTVIPSDSHINDLIDAKIGVIENGSY